jgi:hypothetical protein
MRAKRSKNRPVPPHEANDPTADASRVWIDEIYACWLAACDEAEWALEAWRDAPGKLAYAVYRAAADRADAAQDELADAFELRA